ncbi:MAG TPA: response regulator, partial [Membranihabitans sp.]|nr:response regulator [Membranihabitans sp.]
GIPLPGGDGVIRTAGHGLYIVDSSGRIKKQWTQDDGLSSNVILGSYLDESGDLWVATENGIDRIELGSGLRKFGLNNQLKEYVNDVTVFHDRIFAATNDGLLYLEKGNFDSRQFQKFPGIANQTWDLASVGDHLFFANFNGFGSISNQWMTEYFVKDNTSYVLPIQDGTRIVIGTQYGKIYTLKKEHGKWRTARDTLQIQARVLRMAQDQAGDIWVGSRYTGLFRIHPDTSDESLLDGSIVTTYDTATGFAVSGYNLIKIMNDKIYGVTPDQVFQYNAARDRFEVDSLFETFMNQHSVGLMGEVFDALQMGYWFYATSHLGNFIYRYDQNQIKALPVSNRFSTFTPEKILDLDQNVLLICGDKGILVYDKNSNECLAPDFGVRMRKVSILQDSVLFAGHGPVEKVKLAFQKSVMRFEVALPAFEQSGANQYQFFLENFDDRWTAWTTETYRDFTNLPEGEYVFHTRAKNVYGEVTREEIFAFSVMPPLHRTWWAYMLYTLMILGLFWLLFQWRSNRLRKDKIALEGIIADRTRQLALQTEKLKDMDRRKSRFFANISHEFRTPLTLIKGPVDQTIDQPEKDLSPEDVELIRHNANRLLQLVNQLLDLSKLDAGRMELHPVAGEIFPFLKAITSAFRSYANQHRMHYRIDIPDRDKLVDFDQDKLEKIVNNLLANAFKFTPDHGSVSFAASLDSNRLVLTVRDNGIGIDEERLPSIFNRFYQAEDGPTRTAEGMGIGLALTKELVNIMKGEIKVQSRLGEGTTFTVTLPVTPSESPGISESDKKTETHGSVPAYIDDSPTFWEATDMEMQDGAEDGEKPQILIVEDHTDMRRFIGQSLSEKYSVSQAANGREGLEKARESIPDLVITDLMMPQMDGMDFCHHLKSDVHTSHIPVIILTAKASSDDKIDGLETGADSFLTKPFDRKELQVRVRNLIDQRRQLRERYSKTILLQPQDIAVTSMDERFLQNVREILEEHYSDESFGVPQMQEALCMSKTQLHRKMKALTNHPPGEFLRNYRLKRAAQILRERGDSVTQVAYSVGFNNLSYFARCFKELYGVVPSEYADSQSA